MSHTRLTSLSPSQQGLTAAAPVADVVRFDGYEADTRTGELRRQGRNLRLPRQSFMVLEALLARPGDLVTREELQAKLWPPGTHVEYEQGLNAIVNRLRDALGDSASRPRFIETLPRRGYRFIGPVERTDPAPSDTPGSEPGAASAPGFPETTHSPSGRYRRWVAGVVACVLCALGWFVFDGWTDESGRVSASVAPSRPRPVTTLEGEEVAPALSPDGSRVAFAWRRPNEAGFNLYVGDLASSPPQRLTSGTARTLSPAWSPDGVWIAFLRSSDTDAGLFVVPALGGAERRLVAVRPPSSLAQVSWSPDGSRIAFTAVDDSGSSRVSTVSPMDLRTESWPVDGSCLDAGLPAFAPDGRALAFVCTTSVAAYQVQVLRMDDRTVRAVASMLGDPQGLDWSADGSSVIVANDAGDGGRLWRVPLDGAPALLSFGEEGSAPTVARASGRLAYVRSRRDIDIRRVRLDDAGAGVVPSERVLVSSRVELMPRPSPDGSLVAFQSNRSGAYEIWVGGVDGSQVTRVTSFEGPLVGGPAWCGDGRRLAFDTRASGTSAVYIMTIGEGAPRRLETNEANLSLPAWSADCRWIVASNGKDALYRIPADGGPATKFTTQRSYYAQISGERVVFNVTQPGGVQLWARAIDGGTEAALAGMPILRYDEPWATSDVGVFFVQAVGGRRSLQLYDWVRQAPRHVAWLEESPLALGGLGLAVSADGRSLFFAHEAHVESDVMTVDRY